jgi:hypothetical protein
MFEIGSARPDGKVATRSAGGAVLAAAREHTEEANPPIK